VTLIHLSGNQISDEGAAALADALQANTSVTSVDLGGNRIGNAGATALAESLQVNTSVTMIWLSSNQINDVGATAIADALQVNTSVTTIFLNNNQISDEGATALANALTVNTSVTTIGLGGNGVDKSIIAMINRSIHLRPLFIYDARQMLLSLMCADECGVVWPYLLGRGNKNVAVPDDIDELRATFAFIVAARQLQQ
jgi:hypothetical protein